MFVFDKHPVGLLHGRCLLCVCCLAETCPSSLDSSSTTCFGKWYREGVSIRGIPVARTKKEQNGKVLRQ